MSNNSSTSQSPSQIKLISSLRACLQLLSSTCDGASTRDGHGFNKFDAPIARSMLNLPTHRWSLQDTLDTYNMLQKYTNQLSTLGYDFTTIPTPRTPSTTSYIDLDNF